MKVRSSDVEGQTKMKNLEPTTCMTKVKTWCEKYILEGQSLDEEAEEALQKLPKNPTLEQLILIKYRKFTGALMPFVFIHAFWWATALKHNFFQWYPDYWPMPLTMVLAAFVGGMTSEGSGAVAFPVMTFVLHIAPSISRDFCIMIQSVGMSSAMICILFMKVKIEERAVILGTAGAIPGFIIGIHFIDPLFSPMEKKMLFVSIWASFAIALAILNSQKRKTFRQIPDFCEWKAFALFCTGIIGGIFDSFAGSGIDICIFSLITLLFRVTEKTATPTTIVLKGVNAMFGFYYRAVFMGDIDPMAWKSLALSIPVVSTMGPLGSLLGSHLHRQVVAGLVYVLEILAVIGFLFTKPSFVLIGVGVTIILVGWAFFSFLSRAGTVLMERIVGDASVSLPSAVNTEVTSSSVSSD